MSEVKQTLIEQLTHRTYCRLAPSAIHGIGVFAVRDIPVGTHPFVSTFRRPYAIVELNDDDVAQLPAASQRLVKDFFLPNHRGLYCAIDPSMLDTSFYLNEAESIGGNNVKFCACIDGCGYDDVVTTRDIVAGEELLLDYNNNVGDDEQDAPQKEDN